MPITFESPDEWLLKIASEKLVDAEHVLTPTELRRRLDSCLHLTDTALDNDYYAARNEILKALKADTDTDGIESILSDALMRPMSREMKSFCGFLKRHPAEIANASSYEPHEYDISDLMDTIVQLRKRNQTYSEMSMRLLFLNGAAMTEDEPQVYFLADFNNITKRPWHYVDLDMLSSCKL